jgi:hypothetical protein
MKALAVIIIALVASIPSAQSQQYNQMCLKTNGDFCQGNNNGCVQRCNANYPSGGAQLNKCFQGCQTNFKMCWNNALFHCKM